MNNSLDMGKPNLRIEEENSKVLLEGKVIGEMDFKKFWDIDSSIIINNIEHTKSLSAEDLYSNGINSIRIPFDKEFDSYFDQLFMFSHFKFKKNENPKININLFMEFWRFDFSVRLFIDTLFEFLKKKELYVSKKDVFFADKIFLKNGLDIVLSIDETKNLKEIYSTVVEDIKSEITKVFYELELVRKMEYVEDYIIPFTFPPEIQSSCEQYLIYFATFLKDIGINAETNVESKAHETLFTVIPKDGEEALDRIKEALHIYLKLPESPEFETIASEFSDVGVQQLVSQVHFLKSQLALGKTMIQMKDATIEALQLTNYQQKEIIQSHENQKENEEELAGGLIKANEVKGPGFTINLPELLRRIKRKFT